MVEASFETTWSRFRRRALDGKPAPRKYRSSLINFAAYR